MLYEQELKLVQFIYSVKVSQQSKKKMTKETDLPFRPQIGIYMAVQTLKNDGNHIESLSMVQKYTQIKWIKL